MVDNRTFGLYFLEYSASRLIDQLDMTISVYWAIKPQIKQKSTPTIVFSQQFYGVQSANSNTRNFAKIYTNQTMNLNCFQVGGMNITCLHMPQFGARDLKVGTVVRTIPCFRWANVPALLRSKTE